MEHVTVTGGRGGAVSAGGNIKLCLFPRQESERSIFGRIVSLIPVVTTRPGHTGRLDDFISYTHPSMSHIPNVLYGSYYFGYLD